MAAAGAYFSCRLSLHLSVSPSRPCANFSAVRCCRTSNQSTIRLPPLSVFLLRLSVRLKATSRNTDLPLIAKFLRSAPRRLTHLHALDGFPALSVTRLVFPPFPFTWQSAFFLSITSLITETLYLHPQPSHHSLALWCCNPPLSRRLVRFSQPLNLAPLTSLSGSSGIHRISTHCHSLIIPGLRLIPRRSPVSLAI